MVRVELVELDSFGQFFPQKPAKKMWNFQETPELSHEEVHRLRGSEVAANGVVGLCWHCREKILQKQK